MEPHSLRSPVSEMPLGDASANPVVPEQPAEPLHFDTGEWLESRTENAGAAGRMVLGWALGVLAALWIGYTAWSAGRALGSVALTSPALAQWVAVAAGPLALLGLVWLMFGRTRRKEAEQFTRAVVTMRAEARSLEGLLAVLAARIGENHQALGQMSGQLMTLGEEAAQRLGGVARDFEAGTARLAEHGAALDRAAEMARSDLGVVLADLPMAEERTRALAETLRGAGGEAGRQASLFEERVATLTDRTREADGAITEAAGRLVTHLTHIESSSAAARAQVADSSEAHRGEIEGLLAHAAAALESIRQGIDAQAAAVAALVTQSSAGLGRAGQESAEALGTRLTRAAAAIDGLSARIAEQERASQRLVADLDSGLVSVDQRFLHLTQEGDHRAAAMLGALTRVRGELTSLGEQAGGHDELVAGLASRTERMRDAIAGLSTDVRGVLGQALDEAEDSARRVAEQAVAAQPAIGWVRDAALEASDRLASGGSAIETQHERLAELMAAVDGGVGLAERRLTGLGEAIAGASADATRLSNETGPALIDALNQVREAASHASERARAAIAAVIPESASALSAATRQALEDAVQASVTDQLRDVERVAARAVDAAHAASERLTRQMLTIGQSASALEAHVERNQELQRQHDSDEFAKRVSQLIDSMHSASIDVGKILADEVDEKAWNSYLKGNRGVFTRRAARLLGGGETRAIAQHYQGDPEFAGSVNRYVADFEAMLRRVLADRDGGMMAVTLMSSDVGKLYAALAQAVDRRR